MYRHFRLFITKVGLIISNGILHFDLADQTFGGGSLASEHALGLQGRRAIFCNVLLVSLRAGARDQQFGEIPLGCMASLIMPATCNCLPHVGKAIPAEGLALNDLSIDTNACRMGTRPPPPGYSSMNLWSGSSLSQLVPCS